MDRVKEKKLKAIKSDILEIKDFVTSHNNNNDEIPNSHNTNNKLNDTHILTQIVGIKNNSQNLSVFENIRKEIITLQTTLIEHEKILKEILSKIK